MQQCSLAALLQRGVTSANHVDTQTNILLGVSSGLLTLAVASGAAATLSLLAIHPPKHFRKRHQHESRIYSRRVAGFSNGDEYVENILAMLNEPDDVLRELALETYNLWKYNYRPKRELFKAARTVLLIGIVGSGVLLVTELLASRF